MAHLGDTVKLTLNHTSEPKLMGLIRWLIRCQVDISKVVTLCKLLESLLLVSKGVDFKAEAAKLNPLVCTTFVFCYLWAIGGNIVDTNWDSFDAFVRRQFDDINDAKVRPAPRYVGRTQSGT